MKRIVQFVLCLFAVLSPALAQNTPNIGLMVPPAGETNWNVPLNYNFNRLDSLLSGGAPLPGISVSGTATLLQLTTWSVSATYSQGEVVFFQGVAYASAVNGNQGNQPPGSSWTTVFTGGAITPATNLLLKGNGSANGVIPAVPNTDYLNPAYFATLSGCTTSGYVFSPAATGCIVGGAVQSLTTTGSSGAATLVSGVLNIPQYSGNAGTVTTFSAGNLSPLFTTSVATATTTPALTFALSDAAQNSVFAGPASGGAAAPSFQAAPTFSGANLTNLPSQLPTATAAGQAAIATGAGNTYTAQAVAPSSDIFYIESNCGALSNCLTWVDDDSTDNCGSATTAFMAAINSSTASTPYVYIQGGGSGKAYKLSSCNLAFTGPSGTGGLAGSPTIISSAIIDCAQSGGNCVQMGKTGCSTSTFYGTGCHDVTWRGGTFIGGVGLGTAVMEVERGMYINVIDDVTFQNTGAGNATLGQCTNYSVQWDTFIGGIEFSRNKSWGNVLGQCFSNNIDATGGANTIVFTNNTISHDTLNSNCGSILHSDSSMHSTINNNTLFGYGVELDLVQSAAATSEGGWLITGNNLDTAGCTISGGQPAAVQFGYPSNNAAVGTVTFANNNGYTTPLIAQYPGSSATMKGWSITGNNTTYTATTSYLIGGSSTSCSTFNSIPCYIGANPGYPTGGSGGAYSGFTVLGSNTTITTTWPPSAPAPTFSPSAGPVSSGTTVTTSCSGGSPYISAGTTAVAGGTGIAVSGTQTLYGSCQGSGYFSTGSAAYTVTTYAVTNSQHGSGGASAVSSEALPAFSSALTNGSLIVVHQYGAYTTFNAPTDTAGNTYLDCGPGLVAWGAGPADGTQCFYALNTHTTASNVVTIHTSGTAVQYLSGIAFEITGAASSSPVDGGAGVGYSSKASATGGAAGSNNLTGTSLTPAGNGDLILGLFASSSGGTAGTSPNAFTLVNSGWVQPTEYFNQGASAAITATASDSTSSDPYAVIVVAIKP